MIDASHRIRDLDLSLFDDITTEASKADKRALLGVQRAVMMKHGQFAYLEIGSHLGGSIQPYLLNPICTNIYSIDSRPLSQPDDRKKGYVAHYSENSTLRMMDNLRAIDPDAVGKVRCFDADARDVNIAEIEIRPKVAFIDGEHTRRAVNSDFEFCLRTVAADGIIVFHDFDIIYKAVFDALHKLRDRDYLAYLIEGDVFSIFLDPMVVHNDDYLAAQYRKHRHYHRWLPAKFAATRAWSAFTPKSIKQTVSPFTPNSVKWLYRITRATLHKCWQ